jgi:signal transduction histidine kinase
MKKWILLAPIVAALFTSPAIGQLDALAEAERAKLFDLAADSVRIDTLNEWSYQADGQPAAVYARAALELESRSPFTRGRGDGYARLGVAMSALGHYEQARSYFRQALAIRQSLGDFIGSVSCYGNIAETYRRQSHLDSAIVMFHQALEWMEGQPLHQNHAIMTNALGSAYRRRGFYEKAREHFRASIDMFTQLDAQGPGSVAQARDLRKGRADVRLNIGELLQETTTAYQEAKDSLEKCLEDYRALNYQSDIAKALLLLGLNAFIQGDYREAERKLEESLVVAQASNLSQQYLLLSNLGRVYFEQGQYKKAWPFLERSINGYVALGDSMNIGRVFFQIGTYHYYQSRYDSAAHYYQAALLYYRGSLVQRGQVMYFLADALEQLGQREAAAEASQQYASLLSEFNVEDARAAMEELVQFQFENNWSLNRTMRAAQRRQYQISVGIILLLLFGLIIAALLVYLNRQKRKIAERNAEIAEKQRELAQQRGELARQQEAIAIQEKVELLKNLELETAYARLEGHDKAQREIGQELHDSVGVMLSSVKLNLMPVDEVLDVLPADKRGQYQLVNRLLDDACEEVRRISHQLSSATLMRFGLKPQLNSLTDAINQGGKHQVELVTHGLNERLDYQMELHMYRIVQELVNNVIKHADARNISLQVNRFEQSVNLIVEDDGLGFDVEAARQKGSLGLQSLEARVHKLDGTLLIDSRPGRGTIVSVDFPLEK